MTMEMPYTDNIGNYYPSSAWWPAQINISSLESFCFTTWYGFKDKNTLYQAIDSGTMIPNIQGAVKQYVISGNSFKNLYMQHLSPNGPNLNALVHGQAFATKDIPTDQKDENGKTVFKSFFEGATAS